MHASEFDAGAVRHGRTRLWLDVAARDGGGQWQLPVLVIRGAQPGPRLTVFGAVHGDEYDGPEVIHHVFGAVDPSNLHGTLLMVPVCNVPAYEAAARNSPIDGLNLARVFPGTRDGSITQQIAHWLTEKCIKGADALIDLHSGGMAYAVPTLVGYTAGASRLHEANRALAEAFGAPIMWSHPAPIPPGRSLSAADALGVPCIYTEAAGGGEVAPNVLACFSRGVINVMAHLGMLAAPDATPLTQALRLGGNGNMDQMLAAPCAGHFRAEVALLDRVRTGQRLGCVYDLVGNQLADVTAPADGVVVTLRRLHRVNAGDGLVHLTEEMKLETGLTQNCHSECTCGCSRKNA